MTQPTGEKELFLDALSIPREERESFIRSSTDDPDLQDRVLSLLENYERAGEGFLEQVVHGAAVESTAPTAPESLGDFKLIRPIGRGGMGIVYEAIDQTLGRRVAVKVLMPQFAVSENDQARFRNEARIVARLSHPGIVPVFTFGEAKGCLYIVCELIEGEALDERISRVRDDTDRDEEGLNARDAARIAAGIAEALEYAHRSNVIHRDVKPANILLTNKGTPRLTDFGIAKLLTEDLRVTSAGAGTVHYMSPEQVAAAESDVDFRTDIFSLGVVLYEMLTGHVPFDGVSRDQVLEALKSLEPRPLRALNPHIPRDLQTICLKAIQKRPRDRYQSAAHLAADLRSFLAGDPILAKPETLASQAWRRLYTRRRAVAVIVLAAGSAALGAGWQYQLRDRRPIVRINGLRRPMTASLLSFDRSLQRFVPVADWPVSRRSSRLDPGHYRFVIRNGASTCEISRTLQPGDAVVLDPVLRDTSDVTSTMALIASGTDSGFPPRSANDDEYMQLARQLGAFWIDRTEVSNGEYRNFVIATGHRWPTLWGVDGSEYRDEWNDLPVVNVTCRDAQAYAEWAGKRLPTALEWRRVSRGVSNRRYPWAHTESDDPAIVQSKANAWQETDDPHRPWLGSERLRQAYLDSVMPVTAREHEDSCEDGVLHLFGNVQEWTESPAFPEDFNMPSEPLARVVCGGAWGDRAGSRWTFHSDGFDHMDAFRVGRGFRCAKSFSP